MAKINHTQFKHWLKKGFIATLIFEAGYLILFNLALNLPITQTLVNKIKPDKFHVYWDHAWTWYPFRVHASMVSVNGQARSQQWQVDVKQASTSIALLPLILHKVKLHDMQGTDLKYFQRPRLKPDKDYAASRKFFPPINNRQINQADLSRKKKRKPWIVTLENINVSGKHVLWLYQIKSSLHGDLHADLSIQTQSGPFSLSNGKADVKLDSLLINGNHAVTNQANIKGQVDIGPVIFKQNRGIKSLAFITLDTEISADVDNLAFLNLYLDRFHGMKINGNGNLSGRLRFDRGTLLPQTHLMVDANELALILLEHHIEGDGTIKLKVEKNHADTLDVQITFADLDAFHEREQQPLFVGHEVSVQARGNPSLFPIHDRKSDISLLGITIPSVRVTDLGVYQRYIPDKWKLKLIAGEGELHGKAELTASSFYAELILASDEAELGIDENNFKTDLDAALFIHSPSLKTASVDLSGSYLRLDNSSLSNKQQGNSRPWQSTLMIDKGLLKLNLPEVGVQNTELDQLSEALHNQELKDLLSVAESELIILGSITQLDWLNVLLKNSFNLALSGTAQFTANLHMRSGWPAKGSTLAIQPNDLQVNLLDYSIKGDGLMLFEVEQGGNSPDIKFNIELTNGLFKRINEKQAFIQDVILKLQGLEQDLTYQGSKQALELHLQIPSARVNDMSVYNHFLPTNSPLKITTGNAELRADIHLMQDSAKGFVKLKTQGLQGQVDEKMMSAQLDVAIIVADGAARNMDFDISGSTLILDQVSVIGEHQNFDQPDWNTTINLSKAKVNYKKPIRLDAQAKIKIKDSRPIIALLADQKKKHDWLSEMLTIEDIQGTARMKIKDKQIVIPFAFAASDKMDIGAKGIITEQNHEGVFYARYKKLKGLLKVNNGQRNFDIIRAKKKFDEYTPGKPISP